MAVFTGFYALGTGVSNLSAFVEATTYTRPAVNLTGTVLSGLTQAVAQITGPTGPVGGTLTKGAIFDSLTGGICLCYWDWSLITAVPANFLAVSVNMIFNTYLQTALNLALIGGQGTVGSIIDTGAQIGTMNGSPLIAATRLTVAPGGNLVAHLGSGTQLANADVTGALYVNTLASGNILNGITATPGASQTGAAVLAGFFNRITTVVTATDSCILPNTAVMPIGSMLMVVNNAAANSSNIYPDVGSAINAGAANAALALAVAKSVIFFRASSLLWITIPTVPS